MRFDNLRRWLWQLHSPKHSYPPFWQQVSSTARPRLIPQETPPTPSRSRQLARPASKPSEKGTQKPSRDVASRRRLRGSIRTLHRGARGRIESVLFVPAQAQFVRVWGSAFGTGAFCSLPHFRARRISLQPEPKDGQRLTARDPTPKLRRFCREHLVPGCGYRPDQKDYRHALRRTVRVGRSFRRAYY
jgi:hypothetical protein